MGSEMCIRDRGVFGAVRSMNYQLAMPAKIGGTPNGYETWYMDNDLNIRTRYTSDQISKNFKDGTIKNAYIDANPLDIYTFDPGVVDDIKKETLKYFNQVGIVNKNRVIGNGFLQDKIDVVQSGDVKYNYQKIDMAKITGSTCLLYTSPSPRDGLLSRMPSSA